MERLLTEQDIMDIVVEASHRLVSDIIVNRALNEDRTVTDDGSVEIDNFDNCAGIMKYEHPGDTIYFVQIVKRDKDNPGVKSQFNACQYLKEFYFKSEAEFRNAEAEIKQLCKSLNARAYIYMNPRSKQVIDKFTQREMDKIRRHRSLRQQYGGHEMAIAAGRSLDLPERPLCFIDIDTEDFNVIRKVQEMLKDAGITPLFAYRSLNNGLHIILPDKEQAKKLDLSVINGKGWDANKRMAMNAQVSLEIDKPTLLYACLKPQGYGMQQKRLARMKRQQQQGQNYTPRRK
jgi:hypothetical protein